MGRPSRHGPRAPAAESWLSPALDCRILRPHVHQHPMQPPPRRRTGRGALAWRSRRRASDTLHALGAHAVRPSGMSRQAAAARVISIASWPPSLVQMRSTPRREAKRRSSGLNTSDDEHDGVNACSLLDLGRLSHRGHVGNLCHGMTDDQHEPRLPSRGSKGVRSFSFFLRTHLQPPHQGLVGAPPLHRASLGSEPSSLADAYAHEDRAGNPRGHRHAGVPEEAL